MNSYQSYSLINLWNRHIFRLESKKNCRCFEFDLTTSTIIAKVLKLSFHFIQDVSKLTALSREVISRQATINIGKCSRALRYLELNV